MMSGPRVTKNSRPVTGSMNPPAEHQSFADRRRWILFAAVSVLFGLSMFYRSAIAVLTTDLMRDVPMDMGALGLVSAAFFYTYALFQIPGGLLAGSFQPGEGHGGLLFFGPRRGDPVRRGRVGRRVMVFGRLLMGAGMACGFIGALKIISLEFSPDRFATLSGVVVSVGNMGIVVATTPLVLWAQGLGWRTTFLLVGLFHLAVTLTFVFAFRDRQGHDREAPAPAGANWRAQLGGLFLVLKNRQVWLISWSAFIRYGILAAVQGTLGGPLPDGRHGVFPRDGGESALSAHAGCRHREPRQRFSFRSHLQGEKGDHGRCPGGAFSHAGRTCLHPRRCAALAPGGLFSPSAFSPAPGAFPTPTSRSSHRRIARRPP